MNNLKGKTYHLGGGAVTLGACESVRGHHWIEGPWSTYVVASAPKTVVCDQGRRRLVTEDCRVAVHPHYGVSLFRDDADWGTRYEEI